MLSLPGPASAHRLLCHSLNSVIGNLNSSDAALFQRCYSLLQSSLSSGRQKQTKTTKGGAGGGVKRKRSPQKRKREDLRISANSPRNPDGASASGLGLPETPRRALHTQLLLQLMSNSTKNSLPPTLPGSGSRPSSTRNAAKLANMNMLKSPVGGAALASPGNIEQFAESIGIDFNDIADDGQPLDQLDIDFNEVRVCLCLRRVVYGCSTLAVLAVCARVRSR